VTLIVCSSIALAACGGGDETAGTVREVPSDAPPPAVSTPATTAETTADPTEAPPATTAPTTSTTPAAPAPPTGTTTTEIGVGDSEAAVIPVDLAVSGSTVTPGRVSVPAFLTIGFAARSTDGREHAVSLRTPRGTVTVNVPAGGAASTEIPGLPAGEYLIALDGQPTDARLVVGVEPGP
jgi:hypothetical protein